MERERERVEGRGVSKNGEEEVKRRRVLVQCVQYRGGKMIDAYANVHTIDLETKQVWKCPHENVFKDIGRTSTAVIGSVLYTIGGAVNTEGDVQQAVDEEEYNSKTRIGVVHNGISYVDLNDLDQGWKSGAPLRYYTYNVRPNCVAFSGKIYVFGCEKTEVYDPNVNQWSLVPPPPGLDSSEVSKPALPDPENNRILVHMGPNVCALYAYYPAQHRWELALERFNIWSDSIAIEDGILLMYHPFSDDVIGAYDLASKQWLNVVWVSRFDPCVIDFHFDAFLNWGNGFLSLLTYTCECGSQLRTDVLTVNFRVQRSTGSGNSTDLLVFPGSTTSYTIEDLVNYPQFVALP